MTVQFRFKLNSPYNVKIMNAVAQYMKKFKLRRKAFSYTRAVYDEVYDCPTALDTEATKYLIKGAARGVKDRWFGFLYIWMIKFGTPKDRNSIFVYGRTLEELDEFLTLLSERLGLGVRCVQQRGYKPTLESKGKNSRPTDDYDCIRVYKRRLDIYVHNLGYDIQHLMNILKDEWDLSKAGEQYDAIPEGVYEPKVKGYSEKEIKKRMDLEKWDRENIEKELCVHKELGFDENGHNLTDENGDIILVDAPPRMLKVKQLNSDSHRPIYHEDGRGFRFRDSLILSMKSLAELGKDMNEVDCDGNPIVKLKGDLDYDLIRTSETPLTEQEMKYCVNDVEVLTTYIDQQSKIYKGILNIPDTNTGRVRKCIKDRIFGKKATNSSKKFKKDMKRMVLTRDEYVHANKTFMGGYTHANSRFIGKTLTANTLTARIRCDDFTSSYPAVMLMETYPSSKEEHIGDLHYLEYKALINYMAVHQDWGCIATLKFKNLSVKPGIADLYLPSDINRVQYDAGTATVVNGRIARTGFYQINATDIDFEIIYKTYNWEDIKIEDVRLFKMDYLPTPIILSILDFYEKKTTLKGVKGQEIEYQIKKGMLNSMYGMAVTRLLRDLIEMDSTGWSTEELKDGEEIRKINKENEKDGRFTYYLWGVYVTAYARRNLWDRLLYVGPDEHVYTDTDSSYDIVTDKLDEYIKNYNLMLEDKKARLFRFRSDLKEYEYMFHPLDIKGKEHPIGEWEYDGEYDIFKTLGSKKYMKHGWNAKGEEVLKCTVAGIKPECLLRELVWRTTPAEVKKGYTDDETGRNGLMKAFKTDKDFQNSIMMDMFDLFDEGLTVDGQYTGKLTPVYDDTGIDMDVTDYLGNTSRVKQQHGVALLPTEFTLDKDGTIISAIRNGLKIIEQIDSETAEDGGIYL